MIDDNALFIDALQREYAAAHADMVRAVNRQFLPGQPRLAPLSRRRRFRLWRRRALRAVTGLRIVHKDRILDDGW